MRPPPLHRPTRTTAAQNRPAACAPRGSAADRARLSDKAGPGVPPAGATALPAPSRLEIYRAASASFCRRTPPRQNSPDAASICLRHNTGQILPNPGPETGLFQRILKALMALDALKRDEKGAIVVEYTLLTGLVAVVLDTALTAYEGKLEAVYTRLGALVDALLT